jgi:outer membrane protein assembly factor BamB
VRARKGEEVKTPAAGRYSNNVSTGVNGADVPTPVAYRDRLYVLSDKGELVCLSIHTGETIWAEQTERNRHAFSASPILADGKLYLIREDGKTFVVGTGDKYELLASNVLENEFVVASPVFVDHHIYLRTLENLYCIGK